MAIKEKAMERVKATVKERRIHKVTVKRKGPNAGQKGQQGKGNVKWKKYKEEHNVIFRPEFGDHDYQLRFPRPIC